MRKVSVISWATMRMYNLNVDDVCRVLVEHIDLNIDRSPGTSINMSISFEWGIHCVKGTQIKSFNIIA